MKNLFLVLILLSTTLLKAQETQEKRYTKWSIGARAGMSLLPDFENQLQKNYKLGLNAGISSTYKLNKYLTFKTEINFTQKGKSYSFNTTESLFDSFDDVIGTLIDTAILGSVQGFLNDDVYSAYNGYHKLNYLEMPLLAELNFYKFKLCAGPYAGILVGAYTKESVDQNIPLLDLAKPFIDSLGFTSFLVYGLIDASFPGYQDTYITESSSTTGFTQFNYGFLAHLSYEIYNNTTIEARYSRAFNSYLSNSNDNIKLSTFTLSLTYNFKIKKLKQ